MGDIPTPPRPLVTKHGEPGGSGGGLGGCGEGLGDEQSLRLDRQFSSGSVSGWARGGRCLTGGGRGTSRSPPRRCRRQPAAPRHFHPLRIERRSDQDVFSLFDIVAMFRSSSQTTSTIHYYSTDWCHKPRPTMVSR